MNYEEAVAYIEETPKFTTKNKLEHTKECLRRLGSPEERFNVIHVAGTNGKGSTCAFLTSILREAGYSCGLFTSPHLVTINERFQINEKNIEDDNLEKVSNDIKKWSKSWHKEKEIWYKIVNHEYFDDICLSLNIIEQSIKYDDKLNALEQVETIKMLLNNILESEKCDLNHIF